MGGPKKKKQSLSIFFASERDNLGHLLGNAYLAEAIFEVSHGRYRCHLPQDLAAPGTRPNLARDHEIQSLLGCDAAVFAFDEEQPSEATAAALLIAKFADIPSVTLNSGRADRLGEAKFAGSTFMTSFYPRTISLRSDSLVDYRLLQKRKARARSRRRRLDDVTRLAGQHASATAAEVCDALARGVVRALDRVIATEPVMPKYLREEVYHWLALMPGLRGREKPARKTMERILEEKVKRGLL